MRTSPDDWDARRNGRDCIKCAEGRPGEDQWSVRFYAGHWADASLLREPAQPGAAVVVFRGARHVADPRACDFTDEGTGRLLERCPHGRQGHREGLPAMSSQLRSLRQCSAARPHPHHPALPRRSSSGLAATQLGFHRRTDLEPGTAKRADQRTAPSSPKWRDMNDLSAVAQHHAKTGHGGRPAAGKVRWDSVANQ
jgi:hypothetical protein